MSAPQPEDDEAPAGTQRLDKWLWFVRVVRSRTQAAGLVTAGRVRINRVRVEKPSHSLRIGDVVTVSAHRQVRVLRMLAAGQRRGPPDEARLLFEDLTPPAAAPAADRAAEGGAAASSAPLRREPGAGRPTKRERREIDALRGRRG